MTSNWGLLPTLIYVAHLWGIKIRKLAEKYKIGVMVLLLAGACFLTYYCHVVIKIGPVFTHLFYVPIFLASLWWQRKGLAVAGFLGVLLVLSHNFLRVNVTTINDYLRACMFLLVGSLIVVVSEQIARARKNLIAHQNKLQSLASELSLAEERQRRRIASGLHDDIGQNLVLFKMKLAEMRKKGTYNESIGEIYSRIDQMIQNTRTLTFDLSSPVLYDLGLEAAVRQWLTTQLQEKHGLECIFEDDKQPIPLQEDIRVLLFQAVKELLINVVKHSRASHVKVSIKKKGNKIQISVKDDGVGFAYTESNVAKSQGFGLFNICQRLDYIGGSVKIESQPGHGSRITLEAPLKSGA